MERSDGDLIGPALEGLWEAVRDRILEMERALDETGADDGGLGRLEAFYGGELFHLMALHSAARWGELAQACDAAAAAIRKAPLPGFSPSETEALLGAIEAATAVGEPPEPVRPFF